MASFGNKQYGLIKTKRTAVTPVVSKSVFADDSDEEENGKNSSAAAADKNSTQTDWCRAALRTANTGSMQAAQARQVIRKAAQQDSTVFQYDEVYESMQRTAVTATPAPVKKPRYMNRLLETAERRRQEHERRVERQVQQEREKEGDEFADKESFVTDAYKQKLIERQKQDDEERRRRLVEEANDVTKQKDLSGFYRHMLKRQTERPDSDGIKQEPCESSPPPNPSDSPPDVKPSVSFNKTSRSSRNACYRRRSEQTELTPDLINRSEKDSSRDSRRSPDRRRRRGSPGDQDSTERRPDRRSRSPRRRHHRDENSRSSATRNHRTMNHDDPSCQRPPKDIKKQDSETQRNGKLKGAIEKPESTANSEEQRDKRLQTLFTKRTVGDAFEAAVERYFARRDSGQVVVPIYG